MQEAVPQRDSCDVGSGDGDGGGGRLDDGGGEGEGDGGDGDDAVAGGLISPVSLISQHLAAQMAPRVSPCLVPVSTTSVRKLAEVPPP